MPKAQQERLFAAEQRRKERRDFLIKAGTITLSGLLSRTAYGAIPFSFFRYNLSAVHIPGNTGSTTASEGYMLRGGNLTGAADVAASQDFSVCQSIWFRPTAASTASSFVVSEGGAQNYSIWTQAGTGGTVKLEITLNSMTNGNYAAQGVTGQHAQNGWLHWLFSMKAIGSSGVITLASYVNGVSEWTAEGTQYGFKGLQGVYTSPSDISIGSDPVASSWKLGAQFDMAEYWFTQSAGFGSFLDFSQASVRNKFCVGGRPVYLGRRGELPLGGTIPLLYLNGNATNAGVNAGSGGNFTQFGVTLITNVTSPQY